MKVEKSFPGLTKEAITRVQLSKYAGASGDFNPIHIDEEFAKESPLGGVIAHGMLSMGFVSQYVEQLAGKTHFVKKVKVQFRGMVRPGDTITCEAPEKESNAGELVLEVLVKNQHGKVVVLGESILVKNG
jgi:acyl dehydratase